MLLAGLDIGTTGCKVAVYNTHGAYLGKVYQDYPVQRAAARHEVDAAAIAQAAEQVLAQTAKQYPGIAGIGVTSFGETFVLLDEHDTPLLPAMLYTDPRGGEECAQLVQAVGAQTIIRETGVAPAAMYSLPKLMWVKAHRPDIWARVRRVCLMEDYIVYRLTGTAQIDYSLATRTMAFDIRRLCWHAELLRAAGIDEGLLSTPVPTGASAGRVRKALANALGLDEGCQIVCVAHDQLAAAVGSGVFDEACAVDGAGTVECITPVFTSCDALQMARGSYAIVPYVNPGQYVCYAFSFTGGALVDWYVKTLAGYAQAEAAATGKEIHAVLEAGYADAPTGVLVLPHFAGAATPYMDAGSKGAILGLTVAHTQQQLYQACMEGVVYEMRLNLDRLRDAGVVIKALRATGGGARSKLWLQMKADILNLPVTALRSEEAGATGSAMLVGVAVGAFASLAEAAEVMVTAQDTYYPRPQAHARYDAVYQRYTKVYDAVRPLFDDNAAQ